MDRRARFDFEVDFANGGALQGQGFRLDIDGEDISDDALAAHVIAELRLLMVATVRILDKTILAEPHKRGVPSPAARNGTRPGAAAFVDLGHVIVDGMRTYPELPAPKVGEHASHQRSRDAYDPGTQFQIGRIDMVANTGTYLDTPYHRYPDGLDLEALRLDKVSGVPGIVVRVSGMHGRAIDWTHFAASDVTGRAVLVETGWSAHWGTERYFDGYPFLTKAAAVHLRDRGAVLVGIDSLNVDDTSGGSRPVHSTLLGAGIPIVEHLCNLSALPADGFAFHAVPPQVRGMGTFPVRAHARIDPGATTLSDAIT